MRNAVSVPIALATLLLVGCDRASRPASEHGAAPAAASLPWQPHGLRVPTARCELEVPAGWVRSASQMPDHIAELSSGEAVPRASVIVAERVEVELATARERAMTYYRSGLLASEGARVLGDRPLGDAHAPGRWLSIRWGAPADGRVESLALLAFGGAIVEVVARHREDDRAAEAAIDGVVRSLRCAR